VRWCERGSSSRVMQNTGADVAVVLLADRRAKNDKVAQVNTPESPVIAGRKNPRCDGHATPNQTMLDL
jgi:hypothetical protein